MLYFLHFLYQVGRYGILCVIFFVEKGTPAGQKYATAGSDGSDKYEVCGCLYRSFLVIHFRKYIQWSRNNFCGSWDKTLIQWKSVGDLRIDLISEVGAWAYNKHRKNYEWCTASLYIVRFLEMQEFAVSFGGSVFGSWWFWWFPIKPFYRLLN